MKAGTVFIVTTGEYSDYGIYAKLRAKVTFSFDRELDRYLEAHASQAHHYRFEQSEFLKHLETRGLVEETAIPEVHLADYSTPNRNCADDAADDAGETPNGGEPK